MMINSVEFLLFFAVVFLLYYSPLTGKARRVPRARKARMRRTRAPDADAPNARAPNALLLAASGVFYGAEDWRMLSPLAAAAGAFYGLELLIGSRARGTPHEWSGVDARVFATAGKSPSTRRGAAAPALSRTRTARSASADRSGASPRGFIRGAATCIQQSPVVYLSC